MTTVKSPPLRLLGTLFESKRKPLTFWFYVEDLAPFLFPKTAKTYWLELSDQQWPDESGQAYQVKIDGSEHPHVKRGKWLELCDVLVRPLRKLGVTDTPTTIYVCLWYSE